MWRNCDLHRHTSPDGTEGAELDPHAFLSRCETQGLDVVAVTDHDDISRLPDLMAAAASHDLIVLPGIEVDTDRGHILVLAPESNGVEVLADLVSRVGIARGATARFDELTQVARRGRRPSEEPFSDSLILVGAHVERDSSLLATSQPTPLPDQISAAAQLHALEVQGGETLSEWRSGGVKQSGEPFAMVRGSDDHNGDDREPRSTWLYLPKVTTRDLRHAFATPESSIAFDVRPNDCSKWLKAVTFEGGLHGGLRFEFSPRTNAIIGPPSSGKSLLIDAIRFAFDQECPDEEVRELSMHRLDRTMRDGTVVKIELEVDGEPLELERMRGAAIVPVPPFRPIIFSQTELTRRAMDSAPLMSLLDVHCDEAASLQERISSIRGQAVSLIEGLADEAERAKELAEFVSNPQDGLDATKREIAELAGTEASARQATDLTRVSRWRSRVRDSVEEWLGGLEPPPAPEIPAPPQLESNIQPSDVFPSDAIAAAVEQFDSDVRQRGDALKAAVLSAFDAQESKIADLRAEVDKELEGKDEAADTLAKLDALRAHLTELESANVELTGRTLEFDSRLCELKVLVSDAERAFLELQEARKRTCTAVNDSMRSFFVRLGEGGDPAHVDGLLEELKVGTRLWSNTMTSVREKLDRSRLIECAVRSMQGRLDTLPTRTELSEQDEIAQEAVSRDKLADIAHLSTTWPADQLEVFERAGAGSAPVPFQEMTEGIRALAIKEISFALSELPVVTDQPEDSVPTVAVYESLVPMIREQRVGRQFIVVSHDANVVVSTDVDRILVIDPGSDERLISGTLFDPTIRQYALDLLEGGNEAFELRQRRYLDP